MQNYIGFDMDDKKTVACVVQKGKKNRYDTMPMDVSVRRSWLEKQRKPRTKLHLTFEPRALATDSSSLAYNKIDLLTVVQHELGHSRGVEHCVTDTTGYDPMNETLETGLHAGLKVGLANFRL